MASSEDHELEIVEPHPLETSASTAQTLAPLLQEVDGPPQQLLQALVIKDIAEHGIAHEHGLCAGDLLISVDNIPASDIGLKGLETRQKGGVWEFWHSEQGTPACWQPISFATDHGCLGLALELSPSAARFALRRVSTWGSVFWNRPSPAHDPQFEVYWALWEHGDWEELRVKTPSYKLQCCCAPNTWLGNTLMQAQFRCNPVDVNVTYQLLNAAASYELGDRDGAMQFFLYYKVCMEENWTTDFQALVRYYAALELFRCWSETVEGQAAAERLQEENGIQDGSDINNETLVAPELDPSSALAQLLNLLSNEGEQEPPAYLAYLLYPDSKRICQLLSDITGDESYIRRRGQRDHPQGGDLGADGRPHASRVPNYALPVYWSNVETDESGNGKLSLSTAAQRSKCTLMILMGGYRTNGPYDDLMKQWLRWYKAYKGLLQECHVITSSHERHRACFSETEAVAQQLGTPVAVLFDQDGQIHEQMDEAINGEQGITFSPYAILVGGVHNEVLLTSEDGEFTDASVLCALGRMAEPKPQG